MALTKTQKRRVLQSDPVVGNRIEAARRELGLSQLKMSELTGIRQTYISSVEAGKFRTVTVESARRFAEFFGCPIEDLFPCEVRELVSR